MLIPPVMPTADTIVPQGGKNIDYYEISVKQFDQQILPASLPKTTVWGYGAISSSSKNGLLIHNAPSLTIEAKWNRPVRIKWINDLKDANGDFLPHLLPVDQTLHWANPPGGPGGRDTRPTFPSTPGVYDGPVPLVTHVHGAVGVGDESDGYPEAWYLPAANNIPTGYATEGTWFDFFAGKAYTKFGETWGPGYAVFQYPNEDRASTNWYHDHTLGMTRQNVYAGPAGFYIIRDGPSGDDAVIDSTTGLTAILPGPAPKANDKFPPNKMYYEIPIVIQDRSFNADGTLFYPDTRAFFDLINGPYIPDTDISPQWNPEFFGNMIMVNGNTWPFQTVEKRRYRLRFLNGCQSRFLILDFNEIPNVLVTVIGNEGGFLTAPVDITTSVNPNQLLISPAERFDVIVDFTNVPLGNYVLYNVGPDEPYRGGTPGINFPKADQSSTGQIMEFRVIPAVGPDPTTPAAFLVLPAITPLPAADSPPRQLALLEELSEFFADAPAETLLGVVNSDGVWEKRLWSIGPDEVENPTTDTVEVWEFYNGSADAHPIHVHEVVFEVVDRQQIFVNEADMTFEMVPGSVPILPLPWETGFKDTVIALPGQVTRIKAHFVNPGQYVWHCHILEHEDNEMMLPYRVGPEQPLQP